MKKKHKSEKQKVINSNKAIKRTLILTASYLMEEQDWNDDQLCEYYEAICKWGDAINSHWISIKKVIEIVNEKTGATIQW